MFDSGDCKANSNVQLPNSDGIYEFPCDMFQYTFGVKAWQDTGTADGVLPLMVMVDVPEGGMKAGDLAQLIGKAFDEPTLLRAAQAIETAADFKHSPAKWWSA